jgi:hypothetical protein
MGIVPAFLGQQGRRSALRQGLDRRHRGGPDLVISSPPVRGAPVTLARPMRFCWSSR